MTSNLRGPANSPIFNPPSSSGQGDITVGQAPGAALMPWMYPGVVTPAVNYDGPKMIAPVDGTITQVLVTLQEVATVSYLIGIFVDDIEVAQVTVPAGSDEVTAAINYPYLSPGGVYIEEGSFYWPLLYAQTSGDGLAMSIIIFFENGGVAPQPYDPEVLALGALLFWPGSLSPYLAWETLAEALTNNISQQPDKKGVHYFDAWYVESGNAPATYQDALDAMGPILQVSETVTTVTGGSGGRTNFSWDSNTHTGWVLHEWTEDGTFIPDSSFTPNVFAVGGGAGGGSSAGNPYGGGGGGGGVVDEFLTVSSTQSITIGASCSANQQGNDTVFGTVATAPGGGRGATNTTGYDGGCGGGGSGNGVAGGVGSDGFDGGPGVSSFGGGGGGGGEAGNTDGTGQGGDGYIWPRPGQTDGGVFAGGGGGGRSGSGNISGGTGGGGRGGEGGFGADPSHAGTDGLGGGGGGGGSSTGPSGGGSGVAKVYYPI